MTLLIVTDEIRVSRAATRVLVLREGVLRADGAEARRRNEAGKLVRLARSNLPRELGRAGGQRRRRGPGHRLPRVLPRPGRRPAGRGEEVFPVSTREVEVVVPRWPSAASSASRSSTSHGREARVRGVAAAYPKMQLRIPAVTRYNGLFFGREAAHGPRSGGTGLDGLELVTARTRGPFEDHGEGQPIPVVVNRSLLELYNKVFAPSAACRAHRTMLIGFQIPLELGRKFVAARRCQTRRRRRCSWWASPSARPSPASRCLLPRSGASTRSTRGD